MSDKRALNVHDLDEVSSEHPVIVRHRGGHTYFYNSKAFAMAGITRDTPNPMGTYDKDAGSVARDVAFGQYYQPSHSQGPPRCMPSAFRNGGFTLWGCATH